MSSTQTKSILRSFIVIPMIASSLSLNAFTASVDQFVSLQSADIQVSSQERLLQKEREEKAAKIDAYLEKRNMPLAGNGMKMVLEAEKNGLTWTMIPAIAVRESTGGRFACKKYPENAWGWHSCKAGLGGSTESAIELMALHLSGNHPKTARYYGNKETNKAILQTYNPPSVVEKYADQVIVIMDQIEGITI